MNNYIVGIDIGSSKICGVVGNLDDVRKFQVLGVTTSKCHGIKKTGELDIESTSKAVKDVVEQLGNIINATICGVYVSVPITLCEVIRREDVLTLSSQDREITPQDVSNLIDVIRLEAKKDTNKEIIKIEPVMYKINDVENIKNPLGLLGRRLAVAVDMIVVQKEILELYKIPVEKAGIKVLGTTVDSVGVAKDALMKAELIDGVAIIDIGAETSDIVIYKNNKIQYVSSINLAGDTITNDISICLKISKQDAETLKLKSGRIYKENIENGEKIRIYSQTDGQAIEIDYIMLVEIIYERVREIFTLIKEELVKNGVFNDVKNIAIYGGGISFYRGITDLAKEIIERDIRIAIPSYVGAANPIYTVAIGVIKELYLKENIKSEVQKDNISINLKDEVAIDKKEKIKVLSKVKAFLSDFF